MTEAQSRHIAVVTEWPIRCPRNCDTPPSLVAEGSGIRCVCPACAFESPVLADDWHEIAVADLLVWFGDRHPDISADDALAWIFDTKYTHPTYRAKQLLEAELLRASLGRFCRSAFRPAELARPRSVLAVGCNNAAELDALPFPWIQERSLGVDVSVAALAAAQRRYPGIRCAESFVEKLTGRTPDVDGRPITGLFGRFDICLAFQVMQSRRLDLGSALEAIGGALSDDGSLIVGISRLKYVSCEDRSDEHARCSFTVRPSAREKTIQMAGAITSAWRTRDAEVHFQFGTGAEPMHLVSVRRRGR